MEGKPHRLRAMLCQVPKSSTRRSSKGKVPLKKGIKKRMPSNVRVPREQGSKVVRLVKWL